MHKELNTEVSCNEIQPSAASLPSLLASAGEKSFAQHGAAINRALGILSARVRSGARRHSRRGSAGSTSGTRAAPRESRRSDAGPLSLLPVRQGIVTRSSATLQLTARGLFYISWRLWCGSGLALTMVAGSRAAAPRARAYMNESKNYGATNNVTSVVVLDLRAM